MNGIFAARARAQGKSARTRARLMDAAAEAFARNGIEGASVNEIAQAADVANGTFYNHFRDRDEIANAVAFTIAGDLARVVDAAMSEIEDPVARVSFGTRQFLDLATREPTWGRAIVRAVGSLFGLRREVASFARADLERGARSGVFKVEVDDLLTDLFAAMVLTGITLVLEGEVGAEVGCRIAEHQLRMLGVPPARARRAAFAPLEPLEIPLGGDSAPGPTTRPSA